MRARDGCHLDWPLRGAKGDRTDGGTAEVIADQPQGVAGPPHQNATSAAPALRAIDGGRQTTGHQPPLDPSLDRLWLTRSNELTAVARALLKIRRLSGVQRAMLIKRLNALGAEIGLPQLLFLTRACIANSTHVSKFWFAKISTPNCCNASFGIAMSSSRENIDFLC